MRIKRKKTRQIKVGSVAIGGGAPIAVQSMIMSKTADVKSAAAEIRRLEDAGCELVRAAVPDEEAARALKKIRSAINIPLVADIHFNHKLALIALESGVDCLRINPGNIGGEEKVKAVVKEAKARHVPIRIGVNSGSVEEDLLKKFKGPRPAAMVESALRHVRILEDNGFLDMKISIKSSSVIDTIEAYRLLSSKVNYPLHVGVTEAGTLLPGAVKSAMGLGILLAEGIGDTIRVSLTEDTVQEVKAAYEILANLGLRKRPFIEVVSCPTCGRLQIDLVSLVSALKKGLRG
jgi:(E)-4-hydroxy-3-methylbut-2-enyl-diphosphate synthase